MSQQKHKAKNKEMPQPKNKSMNQEIYDLGEAYAIRSGCTNMPYVRTSAETVNDQVFLFCSKEEADAFCEAQKKAGVPVSVIHLATVPLPGQPGRAMSEVRSFLASLPTLDVDVVNYKSPAMKQGKECYVSEILPAGFAQKLTTGPMYNPLLQLTGIFFCQQARLPKEQQDAEELKVAEEEFSANLVKSELFVAVLPPEGQEDAPPAQVELSKCRFPFVKNKNGDVFMPIFTDLGELQKYAAGRKMAALKVAFTRLHHYCLKEAGSYLLNPAGFALPLHKEQLAPLAARFGLEMEAQPQPPAPSASQPEG